MEISQIKSQLSLSQVLTYYNLIPDKNNHLHCPWHEDKNPSLQVNLEKNFYKCHGCGKHGDQIQWIEDYEKITKAEAINKAKSMVNGELLMVNEKEPKQEQYREMPTEDLEAFFEQLKRNIVQSPNAKSYLFQRKLDHKLLEIGYNGKAYKNLLHCIVFPLKKQRKPNGLLLWKKHFRQSKIQTFLPKKPKRTLPKLPKSKHNKTDFNGIHY